MEGTEKEWKIISKDDFSLLQGNAQMRRFIFV